MPPPTQFAGQADAFKIMIWDGSKERELEVLVVAPNKQLLNQGISLGSNDASALTTGQLANARTSATTASTPNTIVLRDSNGDILATPISRIDTKANLLPIVPAAGEIQFASDTQELFLGFDGITANNSENIISLPMWNYATLAADGNGVDRTLFSLSAPATGGGTIFTSAFIAEVRIFNMSSADQALSYREYRVIVYNAIIQGTPILVATGGAANSFSEVTFDINSNNLRCRFNDGGNDAGSVFAHYRRTFIKVI